jgi:hypothetical protein
MVLLLFERQGAQLSQQEEKEKFSKNDAQSDSELLPIEYSVSEEYTEERSKLL